jgi:hypothetical protein
VLAALHPWLLVGCLLAVAVSCAVALSRFNRPD